jgi:hypothetical protein
MFDNQVFEYREATAGFVQHTVNSKKAFGIIQQRNTIEHLE